MPWIQLSLSTDPASAVDLVEALEEAGAVAVTLQDAANEPLYEPAPGCTPLWQRTRLVALFDAQADLEAVGSALSARVGRDRLASWHVEPLPDQDWVQVSRARLAPLRFGARLWICPSGHTVSDANAVIVELDPGLAFGTGTHPTTAMCLRWLDAHPLQGQTVIDYGCGSGILAVAACRLGATRAFAVDTDPQALNATAANAARNAVDACVSAHLPEHLPQLDCDVLLANILADPLIALAPRLTSLVRPGGHLVLSGILNHQAESVRRAYRGFALSCADAREDWVCLAGTKK